MRNLTVGKDEDENAFPRRDNYQELSPDLTNGIKPSLEAALGHRTRREILRTLAKGKGVMLSPAQLVERVDASVAEISYHAKVLVRQEVAVVADEKGRKGSVQRFYRYTVTDDPQLKQILRATASSDRKSQRPAV